MRPVVPPLLLPPAVVPAGAPPQPAAGVPVPATPRFGDFVRGGGGPGAQPLPAGDPGAPRRRPQEPAAAGSRLDPLDPALRHSAVFDQPTLPAASLDPSGAPPAAAPVDATARVSLEELLPALVRSVAWTGDAHQGTLRLELGAGALAGGTLVVHVEQGRVRVQLRTPPGADVATWRHRIARRLRVELDAVEVE